MFSNLPRLYPLLGLGCGYAIVMLFNPIRLPLRDGFRCITRFKRVWLTFALFGFAYSVFQFATFTPIHSTTDLDPQQVTSVANWYWPRFVEVWDETPLPAAEGVAGIFDNVTTTYPLSVVAAILLLANWRGFHAGLWRALRKRFPVRSFFIYAVLVISALAAIAKPIVFWRLPMWGELVPGARVLQISASVDAAAFIFEYLFGVYIQVYLITVCFAWIRGVSFREITLFQFALRRFAYVLKWSGIVILVSMLVVRAPLLLAYFTNLPGVIDYLPLQRIFMCAFILVFASVQISLVLHNENLREAIRAHRQFIRNNASRFGWFLLICAVHFFFLMAIDAIARGAIADRALAFLSWKCIFVCLRGLVAGWLLASWVCLFRQCETGRMSQESWIQY